MQSSMEHQVTDLMARLLPPQMSIVKVIAKGADIVLIHIGHDFFSCLCIILLVSLFNPLRFI